MIVKVPSIVLSSPTLAGDDCCSNVTTCTYDLKITLFTENDRPNRIETTVAAATDDHYRIYSAENAKKMITMVTDSCLFRSTTSSEPPDFLSAGLVG